MECYNIEGDIQFFDTRDDISGTGSDGFEDYSSNFRVKESGLDDFGYEFWTYNLGRSVSQRRHKFVKLTGLGLDQNSSPIEESEDVSFDKFSMISERATDNSGAVLRSSNFEESFCSSRSFLSCQSNAVMESSDANLEENVVYRIKNLDNGTEFIIDELEQNGMLSRLREVGSNRSVTIEEFHKKFGSSHLVQQLLRRQVDNAKKLRCTNKKTKRNWLQRLRAVACITEVKTELGLDIFHDDRTVVGAKIQKVRVQPHKKRFKELSSLFANQDFSAHEGPILTMKFSPDGRYLASAGEDCIVRVWEVIEVERSNEFDIADIDPINVYFTVNHVSKLASLYVDRETTYKMKTVKKASDSACVVFPPKVFRLSETPLHEFHGHCGEVLDLSWSKKKYLLSSSVDRTVRLWRVGCDGCLRVFSHNNYVTCIGFNPVDDNYFISGSIDGKVRIWEVHGCRVVDWIDIRDIVTAVCYRPDGKGGIVGSMTGKCRLYDIIDDHLELAAEVCLQGKKKLQGKKITGFQFSLSDITKVLVTSADSVVRILSGVDVIHKFKGPRNGGSHISASFTSDGKHIVSSSEESNVHVWNYTSEEDKTPSCQPKNLSSRESFISHNASIAIPWCGMNSMLSSLPSPSFSENPHHHEMPFNGHFLEPLTKGTATWPEEKLVNSPALMRRSQYRFLKSACQSMTSSPHMWGLVIVTAGTDGRIKTYQNYGVPIRL